MSKAELGRLALIQGAIDGKYTVGEAARRLGLSGRRVKQLKKAVRASGEGAVIHGNAGRHPANYTEEAVRERIIALKQTGEYGDTNFTHFRELLAEREHIEISYTALSGILKGAGIVSKRKHRTEGRKFRRRNRKEREGEMLQADATPYDWFGTGARSALHGFIDDATGKITALCLCENECLMGYLEVLRQTVANNGLPQALYADKAGIFVVNNKKMENAAYMPRPLRSSSRAGPWTRPSSGLLPKNSASNSFRPILPRPKAASSGSGTRSRTASPSGSG